MTIQATVALQTLRCIVEGGPFAESRTEPYIWAFLAGIGNQPASFRTTPEAAILAAARKVIKNEMRAGESAQLEFPGNVLSLSFDDGQVDCTLILVVALLEADENSASQMQAGYQAFADELKEQLGHKILALKTATPEEASLLLKEITVAVSSKAYSAVKSRLSAFEKFKVFIGAMDPDDFVASDHAKFSSVESLAAPSQFTLHLVGSAAASSGDGVWVLNKREYELDGALVAVRLAIDPCRSETEAVSAAEQVIRSLQGQVHAKQQQLHTATPQQKAGIIASINNLNEVQIPAAEAVLSRVQEVLRHCRLVGHVNVPINQPVVGGHLS